jgi:Tfp pilus assembly protein PilN
MINLLPPEIKQDLFYARRNQMLLKWITTGLVCLSIGVVLAAGGYIYLRQSINSTTQQIAETTQQLQNQHLDSVQKNVTTISNNLKLVVQVLSKEILFSDLLKQLASVTPNNAILTNLAIAQTTGAMDITAQTANYDAATQLQVNMADPKNQIFSKADIVSISCASGAGGPPTQYPCTVTIRALFASNNPYLFINSQKVTKP